MGYEFDVETNLSHTEAIRIIGQIDNAFAQSLYGQSLERGLSEKQLFWCQVLALEATGVRVRK
jgi:hypothetical protein